MANISTYTSLIFSINFDRYLKQVNRLPYRVGTAEKYYSFTPMTDNGNQITLTFTDNLDIKLLIKTSPPYFIDKLDTTYTATNLAFNHIFKNYSENSDASEKYIPYEAFYFKNTIDATDDILDDNFNGLGYHSKSPEVNFL
jgi:hypothetical protein